MHNHCIEASAARDSEAPPTDQSRRRDASAADLARRRGDYGIDAPYIPLWMGLGPAAAIALSVIGSAFSVPAIAVPAGYSAVVLVLSVADYLRASRVGKFAVCAELLLSLGRRGDEKVLDLGGGRRRRPSHGH
jgi:hypothetical protein